MNPAWTCSFPMTSSMSLRQNPADPAAVAVRSARWIHVVPTPAIPPLLRAWKLGAGETAVLALALAETGTDKDVVIDDWKARRCAEGLGIAVQGTLACLLIAKSARANCRDQTPRGTTSPERDVSVRSIDTSCAEASGRIRSMDQWCQEAFMLNTWLKPQHIEPLTTLPFRHIVPNVCHGRDCAKEPAVHLTYSLVESVHLCVATAPAGEDVRFVLTAYFTKNIKPGNGLWKN